MKFLCPQCRVGYQVADGLEPGMRLRCKQCEAVFTSEQVKPLSAPPAPLAVIQGGFVVPFRSRSSNSIATALRGPDEPAKRLSHPRLVSVPSSADEPDAEPTAPSWSAPETPPSLSPGRLSAPRVPSFSEAASSARGVAPQVGSLAPGASVWPDALRAGLVRTVPLFTAVTASGVCLLVGVLLGFLGSDGFSSEPLRVGKASLGEAFGGVSVDALPPGAPQTELEATTKGAPPSEQSANDQEPTRAAAKGKSPSVPAKGPTSEATPAPQRAFEPSGEQALGGRLSSGEIQRTVYRHQPSVRHSCWQRQLAERDLAAPSAAKVTVTLTISPLGQVSKVSTSGDPAGYPGLANCITGKVKSWSFPKAGSSTTAQIPFTFAAQ